MRNGNTNIRESAMSDEDLFLDPQSICNTRTPTTDQPVEESCREAFEAEARKMKPKVELIQKRGKYINSVVEMRWEGFQMAMRQPMRESSWQEMDTAPMDGTFILCCHPSGYVNIMQYCTGGYWRTDLLDQSHRVPTCWQSIPQGKINLENGRRG